MSTEQKNFDGLTQAEMLKTLKREAFEDGDLDRFEFYSRIEFDLTRLRALGRVVAGMYRSGGLNDEQWQQLFESLFDAGLLEEKDGLDP